jgi:hypothetical protein
MELGARFWLGLVGVCLAIGIGGFVLFILIDLAWVAWGALGTFIFFAVVLLGVAYIYDRRQAKRYEDTAD